MKFKILATSLLGTAFALSFAVATANAALTTSCVGVGGPGSVTWTASSAGGISPVVFVWGNTHGTSTVQTDVNLTPGTSYLMGLTATDASSTVATTTCTATALQMAATSTNSTASSTVTTVATSTTTIVATTTPPTATTTVPLFRRSSLMINDDGQFFGKGMTVQSVGAGSFTAKVWGMTFTVTSATPVTLGDYVDVRGSIDATGAVNAQKVKSFPASMIIKQKNKHADEGMGRGKEMKQKRDNGKSEERRKGRKND